MLIDKKILLPVVLVFWLASSTVNSQEELPYQPLGPGKRLPNPVIHVNDGDVDVHTLEYLMALASAGDIDLVGVVADYGTFHNATVIRNDIRLCAEDKERPPRSFPLDNKNIDGVTRNTVWEGGRKSYQQIIDKARRSGMSNLPDATAGACWALRRPRNDVIEKTVPLDTPASRMILQLVRESHTKDPDHPPIIVIGGPATSVADAYLLAVNESGVREAEELFASVIVAALSGYAETPPSDKNYNVMGSYNTFIDPWAWYILLKKTTYIEFPPRYLSSRSSGEKWTTPIAPYVPKSWLHENARELISKKCSGAAQTGDPRPAVLKQVTIPSDAPAYLRTEIFRFMPTKNQENVSHPCYFDADAVPAIGLVSPEFVDMVVRKRVKSVKGKDVWHSLSSDNYKQTYGQKTVDVPVLEDDPDGPIRFVTSSGKRSPEDYRRITTDEWWRAITDKRAYDEEKIVQQQPYHSTPVQIVPDGITTIQTENFDWGGMGFAFHELTTQGWPLYRIDGSARNMCFYIGDSRQRHYYLADLRQSEWWEYTVNVETAGTYHINAKVSREYKNNTLGVIINADDDPSLMHNPNTLDGVFCSDAHNGSAQNWQIKTIADIDLAEGEQVLRVLVKNGSLTAFDYIEIEPFSAAASTESTTALNQVQAGK